MQQRFIWRKSHLAFSQIGTLGTVAILAASPPTLPSCRSYCGSEMLHGLPYSDMAFESEA